MAAAAGEADGGDQGKQGQARAPEEFHAQEDAGDGAVHHPAEQAHHAQGRSQGGREPHQRPQQASHGGPHEEGVDDLAAAEAIAGSA